MLNAQCFIPMNDLFWLTILLFVVAIALRSDLFFYLLYVVVGLQVLARLWLRQSARQLAWRRRAPSSAFLGERLTVELELTNNGLLPLPWLVISESLPPSMHSPPLIREVLSLGAGEQRVLTYTLTSQRRGYYKIGPLALQTGDVLGLGERVLSGAAPDGVTVYPPILSLGELGLPASLPYGTLAAPTRLFSDPARPSGVRPYQAADGVRRIDWKSSAHSGVLQVRRYQPAISLETLIALAFSRDEYGGRYSYDMMERALVAAASIAAHLAERRQPIGLCTTGYDSLTGRAAAPLAVADGRAQLLEMLGTLGRLDIAPHGALPDLIWQAGAHLGWGSTVVAITGQRGVELLTALLPLKRRGLNIALIITEPSVQDLGLPRQHGITTFGLWRDGRPSVG